MNNVVVGVQPILVTRETVQQLLGGISRTTFWRKKKEWREKGTPFPNPAPGTNPIKGGDQYRYSDVICFFRCQGLIDSTQE
ncbi:Uncharacterised protein [Yersinia frederiksenii]|uniref:hypothetical protein n=1 Tax=Yersinia alsatica TaxID=2890317 RepID=UPI0005E7C033|nr:hypothetical protein [Yersinia alsatica]CNI15136.1 Uncharacterised protein [Yersinia frederiksenii]CNI43452.1 Uncharacterised protein [Yersinia frederiksenii]